MTDEIPITEASHLEPLSVLWRVFAAPQTLLVLMGSLALALVLGTLIPQIPPQATDDPQAWLAVQSGLFSQRNGLIQTLGLFDLYQAFWFRSLLVLTGLVLFIWTVESVDLAWHATGGKRWTTTTFAFWGRRAFQTRLSCPLPLEETQKRFHDFLTLRGYRWVEVPGLPVQNLVAGQRQVALWARPLAYGALLLVLAGLAIVGNWGWQSEDWQPVPDESRAVGHGSPYAVRLDAFDLNLGQDGWLRDYRSTITWLEDETAIRQDRVGVGEPSTLRGVAVRQIGYVPMVKMRAWDATGRPLQLQTAGEELGVPAEVEILFPSAEAQPQVFVPSHDLFLALAFEPLGAMGRPSLHLALLREGRIERQPLGVLYESGTVGFDDLRVDVDLAFGPILRMDYRPAMGLVVGGLALAVAALAVWWIASPKLMWIVVQPTQEETGLVQILALPGTQGNLWLPGFAARLRKALADDA